VFGNASAVTGRVVCTVVAVAVLAGALAVSVRAQTPAPSWLAAAERQTLDRVFEHARPIHTYLIPYPKKIAVVWVFDRVVICGACSAPSNASLPQGKVIRVSFDLRTHAILDAYRFCEIRGSYPPLANCLPALSAPRPPTRSSSSLPQPLTLLIGSSSGGYPMEGGGPSGSTVRFIDRGTFWIALLVRNNSPRPVTLVGARTPEPPDSLVRQTRTGFSRYTPCTGRGPCPPPAIAPTSTNPLTLKPHAEAAVKLNYQLVSCSEARTATTVSANSIVVSYRYATGPIAHDVAPLGYGRLHLQRPAGIECLPRPYSYIGLVGSFTTSPEHKPIPGSGGDMCVITTAGGLTFRSREFMDRSGVGFRIEIKLSRYRGIGNYRAGVALGPAEVTAVGWFGTPGPTTTFRDPKSTVIVTTAHGTTLGGRFSAVFSGHRRFFRGYGDWRCTTRR